MQGYSFDSYKEASRANRKELRRFTNCRNQSTQKIKLFLSTGKQDIKNILANKMIYSFPQSIITLFIRS